MTQSKVHYSGPSLRMSGALCLLVLSAGPAMADNEDSVDVTVNGTLVAALELTAVTDLRFGELVKQNVAESENVPSVTISVTDQTTGAFTVVYAANGSPDISGAASGTETIAAAGNRSAIGPAKLTVQGEPNFAYIATAPTFATLDPAQANTGQSFQITPPSASQTIPAGGIDTLYIGGTFSILNPTTLGQKNATVDVTVTYD